MQHRRPQVIPTHRWLSAWAVELLTAAMCVALVVASVAFSEWRADARIKAAAADVKQTVVGSQLLISEEDLGDAMRDAWAQGHRDGAAACANPPRQGVL